MALRKFNFQVAVVPYCSSAVVVASTATAAAVVVVAAVVVLWHLFTLVCLPRGEAQVVEDGVVQRLKEGDAGLVGHEVGVNMQAGR